MYSISEKKYLNILNQLIGDAFDYKNRMEQLKWNPENRIWYR